MSIERQARKQTAIEVHEALQNIIQRYYYDNYTPKEYVRTGQLLFDSPRIDERDPFETLVGMYIDGINYKEDAPDVVINYAMQGFHGSASIIGKKYFHIWKLFIEWCDENLIKIYKQNLQDISSGIEF